MRVAVVGAGAVGRSVAELAGDYGHEVVGVADSAGAVVDGVAREGRREDEAGVDVAAAFDRKARTGSVGEASVESLLSGPYDVLVEATPTTLGDAQPGFGHARRALERDRHVVLANKGPVAERYDDLQELVADSAGELRFDATVAGAIPAVATVDSMGPERVEAVRGVLNGTANFVLSRMAAEGLGYEHVLAEAQELGVAESDPSFDVEGTDAALKCVILANVLRGGGVTLSDADVAGITDLPPSALSLAAEDGRTVRLIGEVTDDGVHVGPRLVPADDPLAVSGTRNVVQLETTDAGQMELSGRGAGGPETASAVLADVDRLAAE